MLAISKLNNGAHPMITKLIHTLPASDRRVYNRDDAADYVGVSPGHFAKLVDAGTMPKPLPSYGRARRWDKAALDRAVYEVSGTASSNVRAPDAYDLWRDARG